MNRTLLAVALLGTIQICALAQTTQPPAFDLSISREDRLKVFDEACKAVDKYFFDPNFNGIDWRSIKTQVSSARRIRRRQDSIAARPSEHV
jgi:Tricorn protease C1 domain